MSEPNPVAWPPARAAACRWPASAARTPSATAPVAAPERPRIGLVLSGGGARGAAHVGVIQALEEMRIPIDAIAGTSMGAVVGGLYAAGLSGDEIDRGVPRARLAGPAARPRAAPRPRVPPQAGRPQLPRARRARLPRGRGRRAAARAGAGPEDHAGAAQRHAARRRRAGFRPAADAVPRAGHRPRDRRAGGAALGRPRHRAAREHVGAGRARARSRSAGACWSTAAWSTTCR